MWIIYLLCQLTWNIVREMHSEFIQIYLFDWCFTLHSKIFYLYDHFGGRKSGSARGNSRLLIKLPTYGRRGCQRELTGLLTSGSLWRFSHNLSRTTTPQPCTASDISVCHSRWQPIRFPTNDFPVWLQQTATQSFTACDNSIVYTMLIPQYFTHRLNPNLLNKVFHRDL